MPKRRIQPKSPMRKFTVRDFQNMFPDDSVCLDWLFRRLYGDTIICDNCKREGKFYRIQSRKVYGCEHCGYQISPTADTIFHKSPTPLTIWFYTLYLMAQTRGGISAKQIQRETGVTYKTAWRMCQLIRSRLNDGQDPMGGSVEADESYFGGKMKGGKRGRGSENKTPVLGIVKRGGKIKTFKVDNVQGKTLIPLVTESVENGSTVYTDELPSYNALSNLGYEHKRIPHALKVYVLDDIHTNTIDGFWGNTKNGIKGVYHQVSPKYLQNYLNEYGFRYSHRNDVRPMFQTFLDRVAVSASSSA